jgi:hypothetical protein
VFPIRSFAPTIPPTISSSSPKGLHARGQYAPRDYAGIERSDRPERPPNHDRRRADDRGASKHSNARISPWLPRNHLYTGVTRAERRIVHWVLDRPAAGHHSILFRDECSRLLGHEPSLPCHFQREAHALFRGLKANQSPLGRPINLLRG